jgi:hypothetical protein
MAFNLKSKGELFGYNEELSEFGRPVFEKKLEDGIIAEANRDGTTYVNKDVSDKKKKDSIAHENVHHCQMLQNRLDYNNDIVTWKEDTISQPRVYKRQQGALISMETGESDYEGGDFPWEEEANLKS